MEFVKAYSAIGMLLAALPATMATWAQVRLTESCNTLQGHGIVIEVPGESQARDIAAQALVIGSEIRSRLWHPLEARVGGSFLGGGYRVVLEYPESQDIAQIADEVGANPLPGVARAYPNTLGACFGVGPMIVMIPVEEFVNRISGRQVLVSDKLEAAAINSGGAGPGWESRGQVFQYNFGRAMGGCDTWLRVQRFYAPGPRSHFFTASPQECGALRRRGTGWLLEGVSMWAKLPSANGSCPSEAPTPVFRAYNNGWARADSQHRFSTDATTIQQLVRAGWIDEGVGFCLATSGN